MPLFAAGFRQRLTREAIELDESDLGSPVDSLSDIPPGDYFVQGFISVYSEFLRAGAQGGHTVWMHDDQWEGQRFRISAGNLHSVPVRLTLDAEAGYDHVLVLDQIIPEVELPPDTMWVKRFRFESEILTKFWGRGRSILAPSAVLKRTIVPLSTDYERDSFDYPVVYYQGHFSNQDHAIEGG